MLHSIIVDNTFFTVALHLTSIDLIKITKTITKGKILVPLEIRKELDEYKNPKYAIKIQEYLREIDTKRKLSLCETKNWMVFDDLCTVVELGEAGAIAQCKSISVPYFITDDFTAANKIKPVCNDISIYSSFFIICLAYKNGFITDYDTVLKEYFSLFVRDAKLKTRREHQARMRFEWQQVYRHLSIHPDKRWISDKTKLSGFFT